jgi:hypothetical protein
VYGETYERSVEETRVKSLGGALPCQSTGPKESRFLVFQINPVFQKRFGASWRVFTSAHRDRVVSQENNRSPAETDRGVPAFEGRTNQPRRRVYDRAKDLDYLGRVVPNPKQMQGKQASLRICKDMSER